MTDPQGNSVGCTEPSALQPVARALRRLLAFDAWPEAELDAAIAADPRWPLPWLVKAGCLLGQGSAAAAVQAARCLDEAEALCAAAPERERAHLAALRGLQAGRWHHACSVWDGLLVEHPRDALALYWAHRWDFRRGDAEALRGRAARALPEWDEDDPLYASVLGLYAFALAENRLHAQAEETARRALAIDANTPAAVHAVVHVMEAQGRFDEGAAWLRQHQPQWSAAEGVALHLWWHLGLFRLEGLDHAGVLRLLDAHWAPSALPAGAPRADAAALLWRLRLLGVDVGARSQALLDGWPLDDGAGEQAAHDLHTVLALLGAGEVARAEAWLARCAERAMAPDDARRANHAVARETGLPLMRALLAFARGDRAGAADALYRVREQVARLGGGHALRDLVDLTLLEACAGGGPLALGRAVLRERLLAKPATPLGRHWIERLGLSERAAARLA